MNTSNGQDSHLEIDKQILYLQELLLNEIDIEENAFENIRSLCDHSDLAVRFWARKAFNKFYFKFGKEENVFQESFIETTEATELLHKKLISVQESTFLAISVIEKILRQKDPQSFEFLTAYLQKSQDNFQISFLTKHLCIYFPSDELLKKILPYLKHPDDRVVANTIEGIERLKTDKGISIFTQMLRHNNHRVRANSLKALARYNKEKTFAALNEMLKMREKPHFVISACYAVKELKDPAYLPVLDVNLGIRLFFDESLSAIRAIDTDESKKIIARRKNEFRYCEKRLAEALGEIRTEEASRHPYFQIFRLAKVATTIFVAVGIFLYLYFPSPERIAKRKLKEISVEVSFESMVNAIKTANESVLKLLLQAGLPPTSVDESGNSLFHLSALYGRQSQYELLENSLHGKKPQISSAELKKQILGLKNNSGDNILQVAVKAGQSKFLQYLAATGYALKCKDENENTLLHKAVKAGNEEVLIFLLMQKLNVNEQNRLGNSPLHEAVISKKRKMAYWLVNLGNADRKLKNLAGYTPEDLGVSQLISRE